MTLLVAAIEHHARKLASAVTRAVAEKCSGLSDYEASDYLDAYQPLDAWTARTPAEFDQVVDAHNAEVARKRLVDQEAEQEVAEPAPECECWVGHGDCGGCSGYPGITHEPACGWEWNPDCPVHPPQSPAASAGRGESSSRAVSDVPPSPARERISWVDWAVPAICDVLAGHSCFVEPDTTVRCFARDGWSKDHGQFADTQEWREHVAPLIADRLDTAWRAKQSQKSPQ